MSIDSLLEMKPFRKNEETGALLLSTLHGVVRSHCSSSSLYKQYCRMQKEKVLNGGEGIEAVPFIPVQAFKHLELLTTDANNIIDTRHSSGTSSGTPSSVKRDKVTLDRYKKSRNAILNDFLKSNNKMQIGVIEDPELNPNSYLSANLVVSVIANRTDNNTFYVAATKENNIEVDVDYFLKLIRENSDNISLIFGHTAYIFLFLLKELKKRNIKLELPHITLLFGWGWKSYIDSAVSNDVFCKTISDVLGINPENILDMYGFAESNTLYLQCREGYRHAPIWEDVLARDTETLNTCKDGEIGLLQFLSPIPNSYAGASVLLDDIGFSERNVKCDCGREGTRFKVIRRASAEEKKQFNLLTDYLKELNN